jgi:hypothetical protein
MDFHQRRALGVGSLHLRKPSGKLPLRRVTKKKRKYYGTEIRIEGQKGEE